MSVSHLFHVNSAFRIFAISATLTIAAIIGVFVGLGPAAAFIAVVLILIEIMFSFENAIINARILATLSHFWQTMFLTIGILIAIFGMRIIFPIFIVSLTAQLSWGDVLQLALQRPDEYARELDEAHVSIAAFGGMFLLTLFLHFFLLPGRKTLWIETIERPLSRHTKPWLYIPVAAVALALVSLPLFNTHPAETLLAGAIGIATYAIIHGLAEFFGKAQEAAGAVARTGMAGFIGFLYLEVLDASFSLDGVIGAFAVTNNVILIAIGLGVGAIWVRSLTIFMVRRKTLAAYKYLEHGAHYTIGILSLMLLISLYVDVPEAVAGIFGLIIISLSVFESIREQKRASVHPSRAVE